MSNTKSIIINPITSSISSTINDLTISNSLINKLLESYTDHNIDGKTYYYLGKGSEGVVYKIDDKVIKIYTKIEMNMIVKEFYIFGLLRELAPINKNVVQIENYYLSLSH